MLPASVQKDIVSSHLLRAILQLQISYAYLPFDLPNCLRGDVQVAPGSHELAALYHHEGIVGDRKPSVFRSGGMKRDQRPIEGLMQKVDLLVVHDLALPCWILACNGVYVSHRPSAAL